MGCSNYKQNKVIDVCTNSYYPCLNKNIDVILITNKGNIKLELYGEKAPVTVGNFVELVEKGAYENTIFNRVVKDPKPFIIRGGYHSSVKNNDNKFIDSKTGKIRYIPLEIKLKSDKFPIYGKLLNNPSEINNIELKHKKASISMARSKGLNSASGQFYIALKSLPELDGRFAVFGKVISGMNILNILEEEDFIVKASRL